MRDRKNRVQINNALACTRFSLVIGRLDDNSVYITSNYRFEITKIGGGLTELGSEIDGQASDEQSRSRRRSGELDGAGISKVRAKPG